MASKEVARYRQALGVGFNGTVIYTPPQDPEAIIALMGDLERFINDDGLFPSDPLVRMALVHHQFESIHPFYDGNGRTGHMAVEQTASEGFATIKAIKKALLHVKHRIRDGYRFYSQDLINNLFTHPYTKIGFIERDLKVSRITATKYLEALTAGGILKKQRIGRSNYYINKKLYAILTGETMQD